MHEDSLERFLAGFASDAERQQVETMLQQAGTTVTEGELSGSSDSLLDALRHGPIGDTREEIERREALIARIEAMIPRQAIGKDELDRVLDPPAEPDELGRIGRFSIMEFVASGGMGLVFRGRDPDLDREVCIKIMNPTLLAQSDVKLRFEREARAAARMQSERIVTVLEVGEHRRLPYLVMPLLSGESLRRRLQRERRLPVDEAVRLAIQIAQGLDHAHRHGYLHRDIKPDNIWLTPENDAILLDLGLARAKDQTVDLTHSGTVLGTPCYMSPEQVQGKPLAESSDLFSLGIVLFEMLSGVSPFDRDNVFSTMMSVANDTLPLPTGLDGAIPESLLTVVRQLLDKDPEKRPQSAKEVIDLLQAAGCKPATPTGRLSFFRSGLAYAVGGALVALVIAWASWVIYVKTDKGTLVVRADDAVRLVVGDQSLTLRDPQSGNEYKVRVGQQQLPSGVYLLELEDSQSGLTFSTNAISIRRGSTQLVTIELRHDLSIANGSDEHHQDAAVKEPGTLMPSGNGGTGFRLTELRPLSDMAARQALAWQTGNAIAPMATVQSPCALPGADSWSVEPARPFIGRGYRSVGRNMWLSLSPDGRRIASRNYHVRRSARSLVYIWNESLQLTHMLPIPGQYETIYWSPDPNILAVLCQGDQPQAIIWRLHANHAEMLHSIPIASSTMIWSPRGDGIMFRTAQGLECYDFFTQKLSPVPGSEFRGSLSSHAWSPDGTTLVTSDNETAYVWSLQSGEMIHLFPETQSARWLDAGSRLLLKRSSETQTWFEIWNMQTTTREDFFALPLFWHADSFACDGRFERFAVLTNDDKLLMGTIHGTYAELSLDADDNQINVCEYKAAPNGERHVIKPDIQIASSGNTALITMATKVAVVRYDELPTLKSVAPIAELIQRAPPEFARQVYRSERVLLDGREQYRGKDMRRVTPLDLKTLSCINGGTLYAMPAGSSPETVESRGMNLSPRGTYLAYAVGESTRKQQISPQAVVENPLYETNSFVGINLTENNGIGYVYQNTSDLLPQRIQWSEDERYLVLTGSNGVTDERNDWQGKIQVVDIARKQMNEIPVTDLFNSGDEAPQLWRPEITNEPVAPFSCIVGNHLLIPSGEPVFKMLGGALHQLKPDASGYDRRSAVKRVSLASFDLASGKRIHSIPLGYFAGTFNSFEAAGDWMIFEAERVSTELSETFLKSGEKNARGSSSPYSRSLRARPRQAIHVLPIPRPGQELPETSNEQFDPLFDSLGLLPNKNPMVSLSADGQFVCICSSGYSRFSGLKIAVFATAELSKARSADDADMVKELDPTYLGSSHDLPQWHGALPIVAWRCSDRDAENGARSRGVGGIAWYDARSKSQRQFTEFDGEVTSLCSMPFGWAVHDRCSVLAFDHVGTYLGRWTDGSPLGFESKSSELNCWIDPSGAIQSTLSSLGYTAVVMQGNRFSIIPLDEFRSQYAHALPTPQNVFQDHQDSQAPDTH